MTDAKELQVERILRQGKKRGPKPKDYTATLLKKLTKKLKS
jgi:hypothetical protein